MSLCNVYSYLFDPENGKTIKLSDSYQVRIKLEDWDFSQAVTNMSKNKFTLRIPQPENNEIELYECTSVTLPSYKPKTDIFQYGNNSKTFIYMDPKSLDDLEIEVVEHYNSDDTLFVENFVNLCLAKLFDEDTFQYKLDDYIPELTVYVFSNVFHTVYLKYIFKELKLTDYSKYDLDYSSTDLAKWTLKFSYRSFYVESGMEEEYKNEILGNESNNETTKETEVEETTTVVAPDNTVTDPLAEEQKQKKDEQPPTNSDSPMSAPPESPSDTPAQTNDETNQTPETGNAETPATQDAVTAPQEATDPDNKNTAMQNEFNSTGAVPTGENNTTDDAVTAPQEPATDNDQQATNNEIVLDEVVIKSTKDPNENPVDLGSLSPEDRTDELAYRMMRGELDNGKPRYDKTYEAGYTEEERAKAQSIVNQKDWEGLKERHDERVAKAEAEIANSMEIAAHPNDETNTILAKNDKQDEKVNAELKKIDEKMKSEKTDTAEKPAASGHAALEQAQVAKAEEKKPEPKPADNIKTETKAEAKKETANASPKKPKDPLNTYAEDSGPKYASGRESKEGLTLNQWAYISAKRDYEDETDQKKRNSDGFRGVNFSVGSTQVPMKEKMKFQERYHEEMKKRQAVNAPKT